MKMNVAKVKKRRMRVPEILFHVLNYTVFGIVTFICFFPFYYIFINTISSNDLVTKGLILWYPREIHFENYLQVLQIKALPNAVLVTLLRTVLGTLLSVVSTSFLGYAIGKRELWLRKVWYRFFVVTMYFNAGIIPWFINMKNLGLTDNFLAYIIAVISPFNLILVKTYIESMPASLEESAEIDGAGYLTIFTKIIFPLCKPIVATITIFTAVTHWNSFMDTLILMRDSSLYTLQFVLWQYLNEANSVASALRDMSGTGSTIVNPTTHLTATSVKMTISMIVVIPILLVYPFFQKFLIKGIMIGAVKG